MPKFTKQHYEMIADALNKSLTSNKKESVRAYMLTPFYELFEQDNPNFDRTIFYDRVNK